MPRPKPARPCLVPDAELARVSGKLRNAAQHALEVRERLTDRDAALVDAHLAHRGLVRADSFLDNRDRASDLAERFEVPDEQDRVGQITDVERRGDLLPDEAVLGNASES